MKVILPVAGVGSRLRPHTFTQPKALIPIAGKPIIGHIVDQVLGWGGDRLVFIIGHLGNQIEQYLRSNYTVPMEFRRQEQMLGLGHAVLTGLDPDDRDLLVILGDTILDSDLKAVMKRGVTSIGVKPVEDARRFGVVELDGIRVIRLIEKSPEPPSNLAIVGVYYIRDGALAGRAIQEVIKQDIKVKGEYQFTDALQMMLNWGETIETFPVDGWYDCGKPDTVLETNRFLFDKHGGRVANARINDSVLISPVSIADDVIIERSVVGPYAVLEKGAEVADSIIRDSIIGAKAKIHRAIISESLVGNLANIEGKWQSLNIGESSEFFPR